MARHRAGAALAGYWAPHRRRAIRVTRAPPARRGRNRPGWLVSLALPAPMTLCIKSGSLISEVPPELPGSKFRRSAFWDGPPGSGGAGPARRELAEAPGESAK